ncbi:MAG: hypothetical protein V6Z78_02975 [Holosporaceae bacterium]
MKKSLYFISLLLASQGVVSFLPAMFGAPGAQDSEYNGVNGLAPAPNAVRGTMQLGSVTVSFQSQDPTSSGAFVGTAACTYGFLEKSPEMVKELAQASLRQMSGGAGLLSPHSAQQRVGHESHLAITHSNDETSAQNRSQGTLWEPPLPSAAPAEQWSFKRSSEKSGLGWSTQSVQNSGQFLQKQNGWTTPSNSFLHDVSAGEDCYFAERPQPMDKQPGTRRREKTSNTKLRHAASLRVSCAGEYAVLTERPVRRTHSSRQPNPYAEGLSSGGDQHFGSQTLPGRSSKRQPSKAVATTEPQSNQSLSVGYKYHEGVLGGYASSSSHSTNSDDVRKSRKHSTKTKKKASKETSDLSSPLPPTGASHAPPPPPPPPPPLPGPSSAPKLPTAPDPNNGPSGPSHASVHNNADRKKTLLQSAEKKQSPDLITEIRQGITLKKPEESEKMREEKRKKAPNHVAPAGTPSSGQTSEPTKSIAELMKEVVDDRYSAFLGSDSEGEDSETEEERWSDEDDSSNASLSSTTVKAPPEPLSCPVSSISAASLQMPPKQSSGNQEPTTLKERLAVVLKPGQNPLSRKPAAETSSSALSQMPSLDPEPSEEPSAYEEDLYERLKREKAAQAAAEREKAEKQQPKTAAEIFGVKLKRREAPAGAVKVL